MDNYQNIPEEIKEDIINFLCNKLSAQRTKILLDWLNESSGHKAFFDQLTNIWHTSSFLNEVEEFDGAAAWEDVSSRLKKNGKRSNNDRIMRWIKPISRVAAILTIILLSGLLIRQYISKGPDTEEFVEMIAPRGSRSIIMLADGSKVWLNSGSKIKFSNKFGKTTRDVKLEGEAYFSVAKNKTIPFIVQASEINITALGTAFNVKAYSEEGIVETTLEEGSVKIEQVLKSKGASEPLILKPKQKAIYINNDFLLHKQRTFDHEAKKSPVNKVLTLGSKRIEVDSIPDTKPFTSWKDNRWLFRHETLENLVRKLERRYDVEVTFKDDISKNYFFSGSLYDESIEQVFEAIKIIAPIDYKINHKKIEVSTNKYQKRKYESLTK